MAGNSPCHQEESSQILPLGFSLGESAIMAASVQGEGLGAAEEGCWSAGYAGDHSEGVWQCPLRSSSLLRAERSLEDFYPRQQKLLGLGPKVSLCPENVPH